MSRWVWFWVCASVGLVLVVCGWLVPAHLRAVDASVLHAAGKNTPALVQQGLALVSQRNLGAAQLLLQAAREEGLPERGELGVAVLDLATKHPELQVWGSAEPRLESLFGVPSATPGQPATLVAPPGKDQATSTPGHPLSNEAGPAASNCRSPNSRFGRKIGRSCLSFCAPRAIRACKRCCGAGR